MYFNRLSKKSIPPSPPFKSHRPICMFRCLHCMCASSRRQDKTERCLRAPIWICILTLQKHTTATPACNGASAASIDARPAPKSLPSAKRCHASRAEWWSYCRWKLHSGSAWVEHVRYRICGRCFTNLILDDMIRYGHIVGCPALLNIDDSFQVASGLQECYLVGMVFDLLYVTSGLSMTLWLINKLCQQEETLGFFRKPRCTII